MTRIDSLRSTYPELSAHVEKLVVAGYSPREITEKAIKHTVEIEILGTINAFAQDAHNRFSKFKKVSTC